MAQLSAPASTARSAGWPVREARCVEAFQQAADETEDSSDPPEITRQRGFLYRASEVGVTATETLRGKIVLRVKLQFSRCKSCVPGCRAHQCTTYRRPS